MYGIIGELPAPEMSHDNSCKDSGVCGNVDVKDCKAREEAGQTEHQYCA